MSRHGYRDLLNDGKSVAYLANRDDVWHENHQRGGRANELLSLREFAPNQPGLHRKETTMVEKTEIDRTVNIETSPVPGTVKITGYLCGYTDYRPGLQWAEEISRDVFDQALAAKPVLTLFKNSEVPPWPPGEHYAPLASTRDHTLKVFTDEHGLRAEATVHAELAAKMRADPTTGIPSARWGFSYRVLDQRFEDNYSRRLVTKLELCEIMVGYEPAKPAGESDELPDG
jgi:phage head maturation protease